MVEHAVLENPYECCGLLTSRGQTIDGVYPCVNEVQSRTRFSIPAAQLFEFFRYAREHELTFAGIYHSHPDGDPTPSHLDVAEFHYPEVSYWIISLRRGRQSVNCYRWDHDAGGFVPVMFQIVSARMRHDLTPLPALSISKILSVVPHRESDPNL